MSDNPTGIDQTMTLLKVQALLTSAYELLRNNDEDQPRSDTRFLSYLIKMARMEVRACFDTANSPHSDPDKRADHSRT
jgi:hypothetical protein